MGQRVFLFSTLDLSWQRLIFLHESAAWRFQDLPSFRRLQVDVKAAWGKRRDRRRGLIYIYNMYIYRVEKTIENRGFTHGSSMVIIQLICNRYTGWLFGTWILWLSIQLGIMIPIDELIFFRGVETTNHIYIYLHIYLHIYIYTRMCTYIYIYS